MLSSEKVNNSTLTAGMESVRTKKYLSSLKKPLSPGNSSDKCKILSKFTEKQSIKLLTPVRLSCHQAFNTINTINTINSMSDL